MLIFQSKSHNILRETYENFAIDTEIYNFFYGIVQNRCFLFEKKKIHQTIHNIWTPIQVLI